MNFENSNHRDLKEYLDENEDQLVGAAEAFYADIKGMLRTGLDRMESEIEATAEPPNVCIFAPIELVKEDVHQVQITDYDYGLGREIGEGEFLLAMSLFLGYRYGRDFDESNLYQSLFHRYFRKNLHGDDNHWVAKMIYYLNQRDFHEPHARFYPEYRSIVVNSFFDIGIGKNDTPKILEPMYTYMRRRPGDPKAATLHEMTHLYIHEKSKFRTMNSKIAAIDEAAAQSVSNVVNSEKVPSSSYYSGNSIDREVMQAARQVFNDSTANLDWNKAVSRIRKEAVRSINDVVGGEDPIKALRNEDEFRSRMIRIVSYTIERTENEVLRDVASVGFYSDELKERLEEVDGGIVSMPDVLHKCSGLEREAEDLEKMAEEGLIREDLIEMTEKVASESSKIFSLVLEKNESPGPSVEEAKEVKILDYIIGNPDWTDPAFIEKGDKELQGQLLNVLEVYRRLVVETYEASEELAKRAETIEKESRALSGRYKNERAVRKAKSIANYAEDISEAMNSSRENLRQIEEMIEVAQSRMEEIDGGLEV